MKPAPYLDENPCRPRHFKPAPCGAIPKEGPEKALLETSRTRLLLTGVLFALAFAVIGFRLVDLTVLKGGEPKLGHAHVRPAHTEAARADIVDRNGVLLARTLESEALVAYPKLVDDAAAAARKLVAVLPDLNQQDVQAVASIFDADWNRSTVQFNDSNLVVSPVNSRNVFVSLINNAHKTLLIEAEEMQDSSIEQALVNAAGHGVQVQVILPAPSGSSDSNSAGIQTIKQGGVQVKEDTKLYMHAKMMVIDGQTGFVGSENISTASLDRNRELGIIIADQNVLTKLQQTFQQDWSDSQSA